MSMEAENKGSSEQVMFESGFKARIMGIDGTWWRECYIEVISQTGAKITVQGSVENLKLNRATVAGIKSSPNAGFYGRLKFDSAIFDVDALAKSGK